MPQTGLFIAKPAINRDMIIEYDRAKNLRNIAQRGLPFDAASQFDFVSATFELDQRHEYGEHRVRAARSGAACTCWSLLQFPAEFG